ncbi:MAG: alpha/beta fold hydrolase [Alphaproteobacteria bacterium]|nr:alpha/beta fold hydrolase [Alphaproteobacteria bacterium]
MTTGKIDIGGIALHYALSGPEDAPVVSLNHCFAADHRYWDLHMPAFDGFRVLRHDARGHGRSDAPPGAYALAMMAADLVGLLDALGIEQAHLCGVSMGGMVSQTVALDYPDRVASLALINTTSEYDAGQLRTWRERAALVLDKGIAEVHAPLMARWFTDDAAAKQLPGYVYMDDMIGRFTPESFAAISAAMCGLNTTERLAELNLPALVVATRNDPGVPTATSQRIADELGVEPYWLEPARHLATLEHPETFNRLIRDFLKGVLDGGTLK